MSGYPSGEGGATARVIRFPWTEEDAVRIRAGLREGVVMTYPTETAYALGGNALGMETVEAVYRLKQRGREKSLLLLVDGSTGLPGLARDVHPAARHLMERFWPGPLTLVFHADPALPAHLADARGTVALRWSSNPVVAALLGLGGVPLIGTSANLSGQPSLQTAQAVLRAFPRGIALAIDGGPVPGEMPSTLLDTTCVPFRVLRKGVITPAVLRGALHAAFPQAAPLD